MIEFIFVDDVIDISVKVLFASKKSYLKFMKNIKINFLNIGSGQEISIKQLSNIIKIIVGYKGKIIFDKRMKDGTPRKLLDISNMKKFTKKIYFKNLKEGLRHTYTDFLKLHG